MSLSRTVLSMSDRVVVMRKCHIVAVRYHDGLDSELVRLAAETVERRW